MEERLLVSLTSVVLARQAGASLFRVHDVAETRQALALTDAISCGRWSSSKAAPTR